MIGIDSALIQIEPSHQGQEPVRKYDPLGAWLKSQYDTWQEAKRPETDRMIADLRAYNGQYGPDVIFEKGRSQVFVRMTRMKTDAAFSRIVDLRFGQSEKDWGISPTPEPTLSDDALRKLISDFASVIGQEPTPDQVAIVVDEEAKIAAEKMSKLIDDQLSEGDYEGVSKDAMRELCILGTGIIQGPTIKKKHKKRWLGAEAEWEMHEDEVLSPHFEAVSVFDFVPDPYATKISSCVGVYRRHVLTREQLTSLSERPKFDAEAIADIIRDSPGGNHRPLPHDSDIRRISNSLTETVKSHRYDVIEYWGMVSGDNLAANGCEVDDEGREYRCNVWSSGGRVIRVAMDVPPVTEIFHVAKYKDIPHQFWGEGVPREMVDSQIMINSGVRALIDNLSITSLPQMEINVSVLHESQLATAREIYAGKAWLRDGGDPSVPLLRTVGIDNHSGDLINVIEMFRRFADEETSLPSYTHGEQTQSMNKTASGISMLMGAANITIKSIIKNIDEMTSSFISAMYHWNMKWSDRDDIKGDYCISARGSTALMAKEIKSQRLMQFYQMVSNPLDAPLINRAKLLKEVADSMEINTDDLLVEQDAANGSGSAGDIVSDVPPGVEIPGGMAIEEPGVNQGLA